MEIGELPTKLNSAQALHLLTSAQYADKLFGEIESVLFASKSKSPFRKYQDALSPSQIKVVEDYLARIRLQLVHVLKTQSICLPEPQLESVHSIRTKLAFVRLAFEDCTPKRMRGYGEVSESKARELNGLVEEIVSAVEKLDSYMAQGLGQDLQARLDRLDKNDGDDLTTIKTLERIINEHGLVEFRGMLSMIVDRLESKSFEIALFGRLERSETESKLRQTDIAGIAERLRNAAGRFADARRISLDITHEIQDSSELALATAAARLIDNWRQGDGVSPTAFVRQTLVELGTSLASRVFGVLQDLAGELNETLRETADDLHFKDADEEEDLTNALKQMPLMDLGTWEIDVTPGFLLKLSKHMAAKRIEQRLREQIGASVSKACYNFGKMMDAWARRTLSEIQTRFDSHADAYRAHMDRLSGSKQASEAEEISIRRDLDRLRVDPCARPRVGDGEAGDVLSKSDELRSQTSN